MAEMLAGKSKGADLTRRAVTVFGLATIATSALGDDGRLLVLRGKSEIVKIKVFASGTVSGGDAKALTRVLFGSTSEAVSADPSLAIQVLLFAEAAGWRGPLDIVENDFAAREDLEARTLHGMGRAIDIRSQHDDVPTLRSAARAVSKSAGVGLNLRSGVVHIDTGAPRQWSRQLI